MKTILHQITLTVLSLIFVFPLFWMLTTALKPEEETRKSILPAEIRLENFRETITFRHGIDSDESAAAPDQWFWNSPFRRQLVNTLIVGFLGVLGVLISSSLAAYAFARLKWPGREFFMTVTVATMMVPFAVQLVPLYSLFRWLGWIGTLKPLWAPAWFGSAFNIFLLRQFFKTIPEDFSDAARIDGGSEFFIYARIILPMSKSALTVVALFHFLYAWNDFFAPLVFLSDPDDFTLALGLFQFQSTHGGTYWSLLMAASTLVVLPVMILFFFTQKIFIKGITMSGLKG